MDFRFLGLLGVVGVLVLQPARVILPLVEKKNLLVREPVQNLKKLIIVSAIHSDTEAML